MSHEIIKSIKLDRNNKTVILTSASSSLSPRYYETYEVPKFSDLWKEKGLKAVETKLIYHYWSGDLKGGTNKYKKIAQTIPFTWDDDDKKVIDYIKNLMDTKKTKNQ